MLTKQIKQFNLIIGILTILGGLCYDTIAHNLVMKSFASFGFTLLGLCNLVYAIRHKRSDRGFAVIMVVGLFFGMVADIILEIDFMIGALVFALGHVFYILAYCQLKSLQLKELIPGLVVFVTLASLILFLPIFDFGGSLMQIVCLVYAAIISVMFSKALSIRSVVPGAMATLMAVGSSLFMFSDIMLLFSHFANVPDFLGSLCVNSYYPAQVLLAVSLLFVRE